jgi:hypothetical protein
MPSALTAIFGADASQAINETKRLGSAIDSVAKGGVKSRLFGGHGMEQTGPGGGMSGIIRESGVLIREASRGNWNRMLGSLSLMAQYTGLMSKVIKSSAAESVAHAAALNKEAIAAANAAVSEKIRMGVSEKQIALQKAKIVMENAWREQCLLTMTQQDAQAVTMLTEGELEVAINKSRIVSSEAYAAQKILEAEVAEEAAAVEASAATMSLGPISIAIVAIIALGAAIYGLFKYYSVLAERQEAVFEGMWGGWTQAQKQTEMFDKQADAARKLATELDLVGKKQLSLAEISDKAVEAITDKSKSEQDAADAEKRHALEQIELDLKTGRISKIQADQQRAQIDVTQISSNQNRKVKELELVDNQRTVDLAYAEIEMEKQKKAFKAASDKSTAAGASGSNKIETLRQLEVEEKRLAEWKDALAKRKLERENEGSRAVSASRLGKLAVLPGIMERMGDKASGETDGKLVAKIGDKKQPAVTPEEIDKQLAAAQKSRENFQATMSTKEVDTADAQRKMNQAEQSTLKLRQDVIKSERELQIQKTTAAAIAKRDIETRRLKEQADIIGSMEFKGYGLTKNQQMGAYSATPPEMKAQVDLLRFILNKLPDKPTGNPVNSEPVRFGGKR